MKDITLTNQVDKISKKKYFILLQINLFQQNLLTFNEILTLLWFW